MRRRIRHLWRRVLHRFEPEGLCHRVLPNGRSLVFVHINKTGGTSVRRALGLGRTTHRTVREIRPTVPPVEWASALKFAFVRNPWDKVVSQYLYRVRLNRTHLRSRPLPFPDWVRLAFEERDPRYLDHPRPFLPQSEWLAGEDGESAVDFVGRFEDLERDFARVAERLGVDAALPHLNVSERRPYREYYTDEAARIVGRHFRQDADSFGYEF